jgi:hypothetical protein
VAVALYHLILKKREGKMIDVNNIDTCTGKNEQRTDGAETGVEETSGGDEGRNASEDLDGRTGGVNRRTRTMRTKRDIVS